MQLANVQKHFVVNDFDVSLCFSWTYAAVDKNECFCVRSLPGVNNNSELLCNEK